MNQKQPRPNDAVLGGESPAPVNGAVLGGLAGVELRLASSSQAVQKSALEDALKYGDEGRELLGKIFQRESADRAWNAYRVLWKAIAPEDRELFLPIGNRVALPKLAKQGMLQRFGRGLISSFFFLNQELLLVCATSGAIILEIETGEVLWELNCPNKCSACSSDRSLLALGDNRYIYLWDIRQGKLLRELETDSTVYSIAIAPNGQFLAATQALEQTVLLLWEIASGTALDYKENARFNLAFSPDSRFIAFDREGAICLWDIKSNVELKREDTGFYEQINFAFSPDGKMLATKNCNGSVRLWNIALESIGEVFWYSEWDDNSPNSLAFSPDGRLLAAGDLNNAHLWDISSETAKSMPSKTHKSLVSAIAFSPNSKFFVSASDRSICLCYLNSKAPAKIIEAGHTNPIDSIAISPDGNLLAIGDNCGIIQLWDLASGRNLRLKGSKKPFLRYSSYPENLVFSPDSKLFAVGRRNMVRLWNIESGKTIERLEIKTGLESIYTIGFDADAELLACCKMGAKLQLWNVRAKQVVQRLNRFKGHQHTINIAAFSPDGKLIATGDDNSLQVWDIKLKKKPKVLDKKIKTWNSLAFSYDNRLLAIADNIKVELVVVESRYILAVWELEHLQGVKCLCFTPDSQFLAIGSGDSTVRLFEVPSGNVVKVWEGHSSAVSSLAIAPNGEFLASGSCDGTVRLWQL